MKRSATAGVLELLLRALSEHFPLDHTAPGLVFAYLPDKQVFYGSIARYEGHASRDNPPQRQIVRSVQEPTLAAMVHQLAVLWAGSNPASQQLIKTTRSVNREWKERQRSRSTPTRKAHVRGTAGTRKPARKAKQR